MGFGTQARQFLAIGWVCAAVALGLGIAALGVGGPSFSRPGLSPALIAVALGAGWLLVLAGSLRPAGVSHPARGPLLLVAGFAWFAAEAANPDGAAPVVFSLGLLLRNAWPALIAHAALLGVSFGVSGRVRLALGGLAYLTNLGLLGLLPTIAFDPAASRCTLCPTNVFAVWSDPALVASATRLGFLVQACWVAAVATVIVTAVWRGSRTERRREAILVAGTIAALAGVAIEGVASISRAALSNDRLDIALWTAQGAGLMALAIGTIGRWNRGRQTRQRVARVALDVVASPVAGELAGALGKILDDSTLEVLYALDDGRLVDSAGEIRLQRPADDKSTEVLRDGRTLAILVHRADLADDPARMSDAVAAARLALENERLLAQSHARMTELRTSRSEVVAAAAAERRRLERDLHDGSQQRLLALAIELAIVREHAATDGGPGRHVDAVAKGLESEVRAALADLRELAHGIVPRALADDGLGPAIEELAERSRIPLDIRAMPSARLPQAIEAAAYLVILRTTQDAVVRRASVAAFIIDDRLVIELELEVTGPLPESLLVELGDQSGALGGKIVSIGPTSGRATVRTEIPCAS
ncbi:MAG: hypothetical protein H0V73_08045 [Chloroflexi bacterium]|nr:hypothetical protein [Chloroflexota bacterium]